MVAQRPSNRLVYLRDGSAQTILRAATLRWKLEAINRWKEKVTLSKKKQNKRTNNEVS